jgi:hypothetical protein
MAIIAVPKSNGFGTVCVRGGGMAKLDWDKASMREADPARAQRRHDFVEPDRVIISVRNLTPMEMEKLAAERKQRSKKKSGKGKAALKAKPPAIVAKKQKPEVSEEEKRFAAEARQIAKAERSRRNLARAEQRRAEMAAKKKTHLQAWTEKQKVGQTDREALREKWRADLLGGALDEQVTPSK